MKIFSQKSWAAKVRSAFNKRSAALLVLVFTIGLFTLHVLGEGDAFQTAEVLLAIIFFW